MLYFSAWLWLLFSVNCTGVWHVSVTKTTNSWKKLLHTSHLLQFSYFPPLGFYLMSKSRPVSSSLCLILRGFSSPSLSFLASFSWSPHFPFLLNPYIVLLFLWRLSSFNPIPSILSSLHSFAAALLKGCYQLPGPSVADCCQLHCWQCSLT